MNPKTAGEVAAAAMRPVKLLPAAAAAACEKISGAWWPRLSSATVCGGGSKGGLGWEVWEEAKRVESGKGADAEAEAEVEASVVAAVRLELSLLDREAEGRRRSLSPVVEDLEVLDEEEEEERLVFRQPPPIGTLRRTPPLVQ